MAPFDQEFYVASPRSEPAMPIGHQRLLVLAEFLETKVPAKRFALDLWSEFNFFADEADCGAAACACGWATTIPEFSGAGLHLVQREGWIGMCLQYRREGQRNLYHWGAAAAFFDVKKSRAENLFSLESYSSSTPTKEEVAARIRAFVAEQSIAARTAELTRLD